MRLPYTASHPLLTLCLILAGNNGIVSIGFLLVGCFSYSYLLQLEPFFPLFRVDPELLLRVPIAAWFRMCLQAYSIMR